MHKVILVLATAGALAVGALPALAWDRDDDDGYYRHRYYGDYRYHYDPDAYYRRYNYNRYYRYWNYRHRYYYYDDERSSYRRWWCKHHYCGY